MTSEPVEHSAQLPFPRGELEQDLRSFGVPDGRMDEAVTHFQEKLYLDQRTGGLNKEGIFATIHELTQAGGYSGLFFADVVGLHTINAQEGYETGHAVLHRAQDEIASQTDIAARQFDALLRLGDDRAQGQERISDALLYAVGRSGGDEFLGVLAGRDVGIAQSTLQVVLRRIMNHFNELNDGHLAIGGSYISASSFDTVRMIASAELASGLSKVALRRLLPIEIRDQDRPRATKTAYSVCHALDCDNLCVTLYLPGEQPLDVYLPPMLVHSLSLGGPAQASSLDTLLNGALDDPEHYYS